MVTTNSQPCLPPPPLQPPGKPPIKVLAGCNTGARLCYDNSTGIVKSFNSKQYIIRKDIVNFTLLACAHSSDK